MKINFDVGTFLARHFMYSLFIIVVNQTTWKDSFMFIMCYILMDLISYQAMKLLIEKKKRYDHDKSVR